MQFSRAFLAPKQRYETFNIYTRHKTFQILQKKNNTVKPQTPRSSERTVKTI